nr:TetR/AcrR family transcriptional regulator [Actinomycetales bacterium]
MAENGTTAIEENASSGENEPGEENGFTERGNATRARILAEAVTVFDKYGFNGATLRDIAEAADVDLALLAYYFGSKSGLFAAAVKTSLEPLRGVQDLVAADRSRAGESVADLIIEVMEDKSVRGTATGFIRTLLTPSYPVDDMRDAVTALVDSTLKEIIGGADRSPRYALLAAEVVGVLVMRWVVPIEPIASVPLERLRDHIGARLQMILDDAPPRQPTGGSA